MRRLASVFRRIGWLAGTLLILLILWLGGFAWFIGSSLWVAVDRASPTDAIVVLTGGKMRLETGLELLVAGKAGKLFVSGVNPSVDRDTLLRALGPAAKREACCIVLGHAADNTVGNALETAAWMQQEGYRSLRLVTSWYHMHRSLLEFGRAMPRIRVVAHPVFARDSDREGWRGRLAAGQVVFAEYNKFLAAWLLHLIAGVPKTPAAPIVRTVAPATGENAWPRHL
ncbi:MAG: YdcF family protein [Alphaproteobacteria bacterium]